MFPTQNPEIRGKLRGSRLCIRRIRRIRHLRRIRYLRRTRRIYLRLLCIFSLRCSIIYNVYQFISTFLRYR